MILIPNSHKKVVDDSLASKADTKVFNDYKTATDNTISHLKETKVDIINLANGRQYKGKVDYKTTSSTGYVSGKTVLPTSGNVVGDYWLVSEDNHYYQWNTSSKWDDVGTGDEGYNKLRDELGNLSKEVTRYNIDHFFKNILNTPTSKLLVSKIGDNEYCATTNVGVQYGDTFKAVSLFPDNTYVIAELEVKVNTQVYSEAWFNINNGLDTGSSMIKDATSEYKKYRIKFNTGTTKYIQLTIPNNTISRSIYLKNLVIYEEESYINNSIYDMKRETDLVKNSLITDNSTLFNSNAIASPTLISSMQFNLQSIIKKRDMFISILDDNFIEEYALSELYSKVYQNSDSTSYNITFGNGVTIESLSQLTNSARSIIKTSVNLDGGGKIFDVNITSCNCCPIVGIYKNEENYALIRLNSIFNGGSFSIYSKINGVAQSDIHIYGDTSVTAGFKSVVTSGKPYTVRISTGNNYKAPIFLDSVTQNGKTYSVTHKSTDPRKIFNSGTITDLNYFNDWNFVFGLMAENHNAIGASLSVSSIRCGYTSGMSMGSDYKLIRYTTGEPIVENNCVYVCATAHSQQVFGLGGTNIYKLNLANYKLDFVGKLFSTHNKEIYNGESATILFDKKKREFICSFSQFGISSMHTWNNITNCRLTIGKTTENILSGVHQIEGQLINADFNNEMCWDLDFIVRNGKYVGSVKGGRIVKSASLDLSSTWSVSSILSEGFEGNVITRIGNIDLVTQAVTSSTANDKISAYNLETGVKICDVAFDKFPKTSAYNYDAITPCWGSIFPVCNNGITSYYAIIFSMAKFEGRAFAYGDMWIYKSDKTNIGNEYA